jgi:hypothetical protein
MPDKDDESVKVYRDHAQEIRTVAQSLNDEESRKKLMDAAEQFEELARLCAAMGKAVGRG